MPASRGPGADLPSRDTVLAGRSLAARLPDLLVEARNVASTVAAGWHGRRRVGVGEDFWQFRPFVFGEPARRIDWRRSARDEHLYVRERELESAHTVWLSADLSASMAFTGDRRRPTKLERALVLLIAEAELLARSGERVGLLGSGRPIASRSAAERLVMALRMAEDRPGRPELRAVRRFHEVVLFGDFLDPPEETLAWLAELSETGARVHFCQVLDPVEETFPYSGRTEFRDPETGARLVAGRAEHWRDAYVAELAALRATLRSAASRAGWSFTLHHTDRPGSEALLALHARLGGAGGVVTGPVAAGGAA